MTTIDNVIGRWAVIVHDNRQHVGTVIDQIAGTDMPKRVRIQRGALQGKVVSPRQYIFKGWLSETEVDD